MEDKYEEVNCMKCYIKLTKSAAMYRVEDAKREFPYCLACAIEEKK